jgi:hypothetical protein
VLPAVVPNLLPKPTDVVLTSAYAIGVVSYSCNKGEGSDIRRAISVLSVMILCWAVPVIIVVNFVLVKAAMKLQHWTSRMFIINHQLQSPFEWGLTEVDLGTVVELGSCLCFGNREAWHSLLNRRHLASWAMTLCHLSMLIGD